MVSEIPTLLKGLKMNKTNALKKPPACTPKLYEQEGLGQSALVYAHYFMPGTSSDWYVTEYDPDEGIIFGWAEIIPGCGEWGYTTFSELEGVSVLARVRINGNNQQLTMPITVEYDSYWNIKTIREVLSTR
jgi:hypothetical protein